MKMCEYKFHDGKKCKEEALPNSKYCILHIDFPKDIKSEEFIRIGKLKEDKVKEKVSKGDFNFEGCILPKIEMFGRKDIGEILFIKAKIKNISFKDLDIGVMSFDGTTRKKASFENVRVQRDIIFDGAEIKDISFNDMTIHGDISFKRVEIGSIKTWNVTIKVDLLFDDAKIEKTSFENMTVWGDIIFDKAKITKTVSFDDVLVHGDISFDCTTIKEVFIENTTIVNEVSFEDAVIGDIWFNEATIKGECKLEKVKEIKGKFHYYDSIVSVLKLGDPKDPETLDFHNKFADLKSKENVYRNAKLSCEKLGQKEDADEYFYREMAVRRKQKHPLIRFLELPVQYIFGYGTSWWRVLITWFSVVFGFAFLFWIGNGVECATSLREWIYFSIVTATTLGYGDYCPKPGIYQILASVEAIFGTFMWAAFIVIFARKYMR